MRAPMFHQCQIKLGQNSNHLFHQLFELIVRQPDYLTAFAEANGDGLTRRVEIRMRFDDPESGAVPKFIWVEASLSPVVDAESAETRHEVVVLLRDVTERHDREIELHRARKAAEEDEEENSD